MSNGRTKLADLAHRAMLERGFLTDLSDRAQQQLEAIDGPAAERDPLIRDLTDLLWCSIDNDDSRDLDQLTVAARGDSGTRVLVAIADVDALVPKGSGLDEQARHNTTSVYTGARIFPMLPERLSTDLTSLNESEVRLAIVVEMTIDGGGGVIHEDVYRARVKNRAKLAYNSVAAWLDERGALPGPAARVPGMDEQLRTQDALARKLKALRHKNGALSLASLEARAVFSGESIADLALEETNRAKQLIEDFMVAANGVTARFVRQAGSPALRRVVRSPERWPRIVEVAAEYGTTLPREPDPRALERFLIAREQADPLRFPDLSLVIVKLMGAGEYVVDRPGGESPGHFGLAVRDYAHSTAPNRRYPDLITQRLVKAALAKKPSPYAASELDELARHCTEQEDQANRVERQVRKSAAALLLTGRVGERFDALVTGASEKGTWVRTLRPPVEGMLVKGAGGLAVGERLHVKLVHTNVERGFIDFERVRD